MPSRSALVALCAVSALLAGCGGSSDPPATSSIPAKVRAELLERAAGCGQQRRSAPPRHRGRAHYVRGSAGISRTEPARSPERSRLFRRDARRIPLQRPGTSVARPKGQSRSPFDRDGIRSRYWPSGEEPGRRHGVGRPLPQPQRTGPSGPLGLTAGTPRRATSHTSSPRSRAKSSPTLTSLWFAVCAATAPCTAAPGREIEPRTRHPSVPKRQLASICRAPRVGGG